MHRLNAVWNALEKDCFVYFACGRIHFSNWLLFELPHTFVAAAWPNEIVFSFIPKVFSVVCLPFFDDANAKNFKTRIFSSHTFCRLCHFAICTAAKAKVFCIFLHHNWMAVVYANLHGTIKTITRWRCVRLPVARASVPAFSARPKHCAIWLSTVCVWVRWMGFLCIRIIIVISFVYRCRCATVAPMFVLPTFSVCLSQPEKCICITATKTNDESNVVCEQKATATAKGSHT